MRIDRKVQLGELYKELRVARGLKQKDVARKGLSIAQLSKFENGQTMLSADKLLIAIESIHMTFEEFGHKLNNYELPKDIILGKKISSLFLKQDIKGLEYLLTEVLQSEETDQYQRIQSFIIENAIHSLDQNYEINIEDRKVLVDYLFSIESWTWFELYIFGNTMTLISDEDLLFFGRNLSERTKEYSFLTHNLNSLKLAYVNLIGELILRKIYEQVPLLINELENLLFPYDLLEIMLLKFLKLIDGYSKSKNSKKEIKHFIESLRVIGNSELTDILEMKLDQFGIQLNGE
ncbi:helix-turn-helix domain-containing protein [Streptococcus australis]|uniref:Rgg/GadR/MutR family transcriptional regulator n=1 Tax=Streptococcus australis TaxID=113107 RepID=UPI001CC0D858|nr:Rgg/GadR/MutR family transcriptional regulator [Streptococcus australis]MBZ2154495.1 helix-turn-helix domain-containing protein [Streptococcus australis]MBZ2158744.1 helix-turn-helix domain-containing protein [Streptococcus australis]